MNMSEPIQNNKNNKPLFYDPSQRRIRSFVTRAGRLSNAQEQAIQKFGPQYMLPFKKELLDFKKSFENDAETILEIGFGMGDTTALIAKNIPDKNFLGIEVHTPGVGNLLKLIDEYPLQNVRIIQYDAVEVIEHMIPDQSLNGVHIFFPDPWHKARHQKRRLIQSPFMEKLTPKLKSGGYIHCATDWEPYAIQILEVLENASDLINTVKDFAPRPSYRPETKFEKRGKRLGHGIWDILFVKK